MKLATTWETGMYSSYTKGSSVCCYILYGKKYGNICQTYKRTFTLVGIYTANIFNFKMTYYQVFHHGVFHNSKTLETT